jgi:hypothetical protein
MGLTLGVDSRQMEFEESSIVIGRSPSAQLSLADDRLAAEHAILRQVAGRWLIEAQADGVIRVGDGRPTKVAWLTPGDIIHLTEAGPCLTFSPTASPADPDVILMPPVPLKPPSVPLPEAPLPPEPSPPASVIPPRSQPIVVASPFALIPPAVRMAALSITVVLGLVAVVFQITKTPATGVNGVPGNITSSGVTRPIPPLGEIRSAAARHEPATHSQPQQANVAVLPSQLAAAVHLVLVSAPDRDQTYRLGAAWVVGARRLVTSGAVGQGIQHLREQLPLATVQGVGKSPSAEVQQVLVHPEYVRLAQVAATAQAELDELRSALEDSRDETAAEAAKPKMLAIQDRLLEALQQQLDVDLAVLLVNRDLPPPLAVATDDLASARPGSSVRALGFPFPLEEFLVDPAFELSPTEVTGQVQAKVTTHEGNVRRWLVKFREANPAENWSGSPVLNGQGQVIGVYSRPTPPVELREDYVPATHEITCIERLKEIPDDQP